MFHANENCLDKSIVSESMYAINGILILVVVYLHLLSGFGYSQRPILRIPVEVFGFFMAWFYYKSGGYYRENRSLWDTFVKECKRSLVPYLLFTLLGLVIYNGTNLLHIDTWKRVADQMLTYGSVSEQGPLWFILDFFLVKLIGTCVLRFLSKETVVMASFVITILFQYLPLPPLVSRLPLGVFLYSLGYSMQKIQYNSIIFGIGLSIYAVCEMTMSCIFDYRVNTYSNYFAILLFCVCGCISINNVVTRLKIIRANRILQYIGKNAMVIYLLHWFYIRTLGMDMGFPMSCFIRVVLAVMLMILTLPLLSILLNKRCLKWMIGK